MRFLDASRFGLIMVLALGLVADAPAQESFTEDFTTTTYKDELNTTAYWNTGTGELSLPPFELTLAGSYDTPGGARAVVVVGDLAFVADGFPSGVQVIDISDPAVPTPVSSFGTADWPRDVAIAGDLAFVANWGSGLHVHDITDPSTVTFVGSHDTPGNATGVAVAGDLAFVTDRDFGLQIIDITDPTNPSLVGSYDTPGYAWDIVVAGDLVFVADGPSGLQVIDISDPTNPSLVDNYDYTGDCWGVAVAGDLAFTADDSRVRTFDIGDPTNLTLLDTYYTGGGARGVTVAGDLAFVADESNGLLMFDISEPTNLTYVGGYATPDKAHGVAVEGPLAFVADFDRGLQIVKYVDPAAPAPVGNWPTPDITYKTAVAGDLAFVVDVIRGVQVIDISDPELPVQVGSFGTLLAFDIAVAGDLALVSDADTGFKVFDISDPTNPMLTGGVPLLDVGHGVDVAGDLAFAAVYDSTLQVIDITDPANPSVVGQYDTASWAEDVVVAGDLAFVAVWDRGLEVVDITDPANPTLLGSYDTPGEAYDLAVAGDLAFLADGASGLQIVDVSDPTNPTLTGSYVTPDDAWDVAVAGDRAFVASYKTGGLQVIDIIDPTNPTLVDSYDTPGWAHGVTVEGNLAFVADNDAMRVFQIFRNVDTSGNVGQSLAVDVGTDLITHARLSSTETAGIAWQVSADAGTNWQAIVSGDPWLPFTLTGDDLLWRTTHTWLPGVNPTVSALTLEWLNEFGLIMSIADVPEDQGGWVRLDISRSGYDFAEETTWPVAGYWVYQRVDSGAMRARIATEGMPAVAAAPELAVLGDVRVLADRTFVVGGEKAAASLPPGTWEVVGSVPAMQQDRYDVRVPTLADSTTTGTAWSVYLVTTHTTTPSVWFACRPDSGYSVDNIAPEAPAAITASYAASGVVLDWNDAPEADFQYYRIYRGTNPGFVPSPNNLAQEVATSGWTDPTTDPWSYHYQITVLDHAGNESAAGWPVSVSSTRDGEVPVRTALWSAAPNPFNPATKLSFGMAVPGRACLKVYDAAGRLVITLLNAHRDAGRHHVIWNGRDKQGRMSPAGVYLYRLQADGFDETKRMMLVK